MNQSYVKSLLTFLVINATIWVVLSAAFGTVLTIVGFIFNLAVGIVFHRLFCWKGNGNS